MFVVERLVLRVFAMLVLLTAPVQAETLATLPKEIVIATDDWCPLTCAEKGMQGGVIGKRLVEALAPHGIKVRYAFTGWSRAIASAKEGTFDGVLGAAAEEAEGLRLHSEPIYWSEDVLVKRADLRWHYTGPSSLSDVKIGAIRSYWYGPLLDRYFRQNEHDPSKVMLLSGDLAQEAVVRLLRRRRVDVMAIERNVFRYYFEDSSGTMFRVGATINRSPLYAGFAPDKPYTETVIELLDAYLRAKKEARQ